MLTTGKQDSVRRCVVCIKGGAEPEYGIRKGTNSVFLRILISNKYLKNYLYSGARKTLYQKAAFPHGTTVHARVSERERERERRYVGGRGGGKSCLAQVCPQQQTEKARLSEKNTSLHHYF